MASLQSQLEDTRSIDELFEAACSLEDEDARWDAISILHYRGGDTAFKRCLELLKSDDSRTRMDAVDILAQLFVPNDYHNEGHPSYKRLHPRRLVSVLLDILHSNADDELLATVCIALSHNKASRAIDSLVALKNHPNREVRYGVTLALLTYEDNRAVKALIELSRDEDDEIRNWATFGLAQQIDLDTKYIREALIKCLDDSFDAVRGEALHGLATRGDERVIEPLIKELYYISEAKELWGYAFEAAVDMPDPRLYAALVAVLDSGVGDCNLDQAIALCRIPSLEETGDNITDAVTRCPVCGLSRAFKKSESWQYCKRCGWFDDAEQRADPELADKGNLRSLNYERERWRQRVEMAKKSEDNTK
jgi:hypothetical protein